MDAGRSAEYVLNCENYSLTPLPLISGVDAFFAKSPDSNDAFIIGICLIYTQWIIEIGLVLKMNAASHPWRRCRA
jgi:hypothetical protein